MSDEKFKDLISGWGNYEQVVSMVQNDYSFVNDLLGDNENSDAILGWAMEHKDEVLEELGVSDDENS